jgi:CBS domain-containing protein
MQLKEVMSPHVETIGPQDSLSAAGRRMLDHGIHHLVVVQHGLVTGLLTRDRLESRRDEGATRVDDAMLRNIVTAPPGMSVAAAAALMTPGHPQTGLPVVVGGRLVGIVTLSDLLSLVGKTGRHTGGGRERKEST